MGTPQERHKKGHMIMNRFEMDLNKERKKAATQVGRTHDKGRRDAQTKHTSKWDGVHPKIFPRWRWEAQITAFKEYKDGESSNTQDNTGRPQTPQNRERKEHEQEFGKTTAAAPSA